MNPQLRCLCMFTISNVAYFAAEFSMVIEPFGTETNGRFKHGLTLIPAWIRNHTPSKVWDEITYPFLNFNGTTVEVYEWISNFVLHIRMGAITLSMLGLKLNHVSKRGPRYAGRTRSTPCLLLSWLPSSPTHQHPWNYVLLSFRLYYLPLETSCRIYAPGNWVIVGSDNDMYCDLSDTMPLSEPMLIYRQLDPLNKF